MHEYSIVQALLARVETEVEAHDATAVHRLRVKIGELSGVEIDLLQSAYEVFSPQSVCKGAPLEIVPVAARWACPTCARTMHRGEVLRCPACGLPARLIEGSEIVLERLEMEVA